MHHLSVLVIKSMLEKKSAAPRNSSGDRQNQGLKDCQAVFGLTFVTGLRPCNMKSMKRLFTMSPDKFIYIYIHITYIYK